MILQRMLIPNGDKPIATLNSGFYAAAECLDQFFSQDDGEAEIATRMMLWLRHGVTEQESQAIENWKQNNLKKVQDNFGYDLVAFIDLCVSTYFEIVNLELIDNNVDSNRKRLL